MGYAGFNRLRTKVAELTGPEIWEHYKKLNQAIFLDGEKREAFFNEYDIEISRLEEIYHIPHGVLDFLYASDGSGNISFDKCKEIWEVIKNYDDHLLYGYVGRKDCAKFKDFKEIVKDCMINKSSMEWY